jgi:hypothetical protein
MTLLASREVEVVLQARAYHVGSLAKSGKRPRCVDVERDRSVSCVRLTPLHDHGLREKVHIPPVKVLQFHASAGSRNGENSRTMRNSNT